MKQYKQMTEEELSPIIEELKQIRSSYLAQVLDIGKKMLSEDLRLGCMFATGVANSMLRLSKNFTRCIEDRDLIMSASVIRMMVDTVITYFGAWQVENPSDYIYSIMDGKEIKDNIGRNGKRLSYSSLARRLDAEFAQEIHKIYKYTCAGIHFSSMHLFSHFSVEEKKSGKKYITASITEENVNPMETFQICEMLICEYKCWACFLWLMNNYSETKPRSRKEPS